MKLKTIAAILALSSSTLFAQTVDVQGAWARATVPGQKATGAFMKLTAKEGTKLVGVSSPVAGVSEVHEMKMDGDVMKMRAVAGGLDLPAGKTVELKPGGYHVMLMDLKAPLKAGESVELSLVVEDKDGKKETIAVKAPVRALGADAGGHGTHKH